VRLVQFLDLVACGCSDENKVPSIVVIRNSIFAVVHFRVVHLSSPMEKSSLGGGGGGGGGVSHWGGGGGASKIFNKNHKRTQ